MAHETQLTKENRSMITNALHSGMITALVSELRGKYRVEADHLSVTFASLVSRPPLIECPAGESWGDHRPDIVARHTQADAHVRETLYHEKVKPFVIEVETDDSLEAGETADQLRLFNWYAQKNGYDFYIAVPPSSREKAARLIENLELNAQIWQ